MCARCTLNILYQNGLRAYIFNQKDFYVAEHSVRVSKCVDSFPSISLSLLQSLVALFELVVNITINESQKIKSSLFFDSFSSFLGG